MPQRLDELLQDCTVKITVPGGWGTGFFVAPGLVLTCDHVVKALDADDRAQIDWQQQSFAEAAVVERRPQVDLALLQCAPPPDVEMPCVYLGEAFQPRDDLYTYGYPDSFPQGTSVTGVCEGSATENGSELLVFKLAQVRPGLSGAPLLNWRTGRVCGMVKFTRDRSIDLGGGAIPTQVILEQFPQLRDQQRQFNQANRRWHDLVTKPEDGVDFESYLQGLTTTYQDWWTHYTLTDATGRIAPPESERPSPFDFGLMVQTVAKDKDAPSSDLRSEEREKIERLPVLEGIRKYADDHVLLVGRPGSGKSTALIRLLLEEATQALQQGEGQVPVLLELRYWNTSIEGLIQGFLQRHGLTLDDSALSTLLSQGRFLLLIDGLNELPSESARTQLTAFRRNQPKVPMIFTTRDLGLGGDLGIEKKLEMQPLTEPQMKDFIRAYVPDQAEAMLWQLNNRLREFGQTPLLLWMLCEVFQQSPQRQMPNNLAEVFRAFTTMYEDSSVRKHEVALLKGDVRPLSDRRLWKEALKALAFLMMQGETPVDFRVAIQRTEAERELSKLFANEKFPVRDILDDLLKYHLLQNRSADQLEFRHQLIQEYYAAEYLLRLLPELSDDQLKRDYLNLLKWTEPLALMLALVDDEAQALRVVKLAMDDVDLMLGARLAGEVKAPLQPKTIGWIGDREIPTSLKVNCWTISRSEAAIPDLLQALQHQDREVRTSAAKALGQLGSEAAIPGLLQALQHQDWSIRTSAAEALGQLGSEAAIPGLFQVLQDQYWNVRSRAAEALGQLGSEAAIPSLLQALQHQEEDVRWRAAEALGQLGSEAAIPGLLQALQHRDRTVRSRAAEALGQLGSEAAIPDLLQALQHQDREVRSRAAEALGQLGSEAAIPGLLQALQHQDREVRTSVAEALGQLGSEAAIPDLLQALQHQDREVSSRAAEALGQLGSEAAIPGLLQALQHQDREVSSRAAEALGQLRSEAAIPGWLQALQHQDSVVRWRAAEALGQLRSEAAIPGLLQALQYQNREVRWRAAEALGQLGSEAAIPGLLQALQHQDREVRWRAAEALGQLGSEAAIPGLLQALQHQGREVRWRAAEALGQLGSEAAIPGLLQALQHQDREVRTSVAEVLGQLGSEAAIPDLLQALQHQDREVRWRAAEALGQFGSATTMLDLWQLHLRQPENHLEEAISAIQDRCKFYSYEIFQSIIPRGQTISLYVSYASADEALQTQLVNHLTLLERQGVITSWSSRQILPGDDRTQTIHHQLNTADIILLLISAYSLADDTCYHLEIQRAMERHQSGKARVIPILLRPVDWQSAPFSRLDILPKNHQPVTTWPNQDQAFQEIAAGIREAALELRRNTPAAG